MQIIYETINHWNRENGINPWRYIGSDQHNKENYFGSNKKLKEDIKILGKEFFEKKIVLYFHEESSLTNIDLRNIEIEIQKNKNCVQDPTYYNRTNSSHKGYIETEEEKLERMSKCRDGHKKWLENLTEKERLEIGKYIRNLSLNKRTAYVIWLEKYGKEEADRRQESFKIN